MVGSDVRDVVADPTDVATAGRLHGGSEKRPTHADTKSDDAKLYNPNYLTYEVVGPAGTVADISYFNANGDPRFVKAASLPWWLKFAVTQAVGCRIVADGEVKAGRTSNEENAFTFCLLKAA